MKNQLRVVFGLLLLCCASSALAGGGPDSYRSVTPLAESVAKSKPMTPCDYCGRICLPAQPTCCRSEDDSFETTTPLWEMFATSKKPHPVCDYCGSKCLPAQPTCCRSEDHSFKTTVPLHDIYRHQKKAMPFFGCQSCPDCAPQCGTPACGCAK